MGSGFAETSESCWHPDVSGFAKPCPPSLTEAMHQRPRNCFCMSFLSGANIACMRGTKMLCLELPLRCCGHLTLTTVARQSRTPPSSTSMTPPSDIPAGNASSVTVNGEARCQLPCGRKDGRHAASCTSLHCAATDRRGPCDIHIAPPVRKPEAESSATGWPGACLAAAAKIEIGPNKGNS